MAESQTPPRVYLLWHTHVLPNREEDEKLLGVYSSEERALARAEEAKRLPGFADAPEGFLVDDYEVDADHWTEGFDRS
jgi:hypothetical protein